MSMIETIRSRVDERVMGRSHLHGARLAFIRGLSRTEDIEAASRRLKGDDSLTDKGRRRALAAALKAQLIGIRADEAGLDRARRELSARRSTMLSFPTDDGNVVAYLRRQEIRDQLRKLSPAKALAQIADAADEETVTAVLELPPKWIGLNPPQVDELVMRLAQRLRPDVFAEFEQEAGQLELAEVAHQVSKQAALEAGLFSSSAELEAWVASDTEDLPL